MNSNKKKIPDDYYKKLIVYYKLIQTSFYFYLENLQNCITWGSKCRENLNNTIICQ